MKTWIIAAMFFSTAAVATAFTPQEYITIRKLPRSNAAHQRLVSYVQGLGDGILTTSIYKEATYGRATYCDPPDSGLAVEHYLEMLDEGLAQRVGGLWWKEFHDKPSTLGLVLLRQLEAKFPCKAR
jgi:hypothetical protein